MAFSPIGYRNDLIVRGGGPSENRYYLDGIEIPNINHFSTQGASGGPVGLVDADLIRSVKFFSGAFPADKGNALSSILDFRLRDGNQERHSLKATLGASEFAVTANGPVGKKATYMASVRQSYLQMLFKILGLPLLPNYTDASFKIKTRFNAQNEWTVLGVGGLDRMKLNFDIEGDHAEYILGYLPKINQETFTLGSIYRHYADRQVSSLYVSHSFFRNREQKYKDNKEENPNLKTLQLRSTEQESKLKFTHAVKWVNWELQAGVNLAVSQFRMNSFRRVFLDDVHEMKYDTRLNLFHYGIFASVNYNAESSRLKASLGIRGDGNTYNRTMSRFWEQLSPRLSLSYRIHDRLYANLHTALYHQLPPYIALGYQEKGVRVNKELRYVTLIQNSIGLSWNPLETMELSLEGFFKNYRHLPLSVNDGIPLACQGNDYGAVGNERLSSNGIGRSRGMELMFKWLWPKKLNLSAAITYFRTEFKAKGQEKYIPAAWDNRFIVNVSGTYNFRHHWSLGMRIAAIGGTPSTPYDVEKSSLIDAWDATGKPYLDYSLYNTQRLPAYYRIDVRVDKVFYLKRCMLGIYFDIQNITASKLKQPDLLISTGQVSASDPTRYEMRYIENESGTVLPTLGLTFEY